MNPGNIELDSLLLSVRLVNNSAQSQIFSLGLDYRHFLTPAQPHAKG